MGHDVWSYRLIRGMVRSLVGTGLTPNHLTAARLLTGLGACAAFATGLRDWEIWGGVLWIISMVLDRADGELARLANMVSRGGHLFDFASDVAVSSLVFVAIGIGFRHSGAGVWAPVMGIVAGGSVAVASVLSEMLENREGNGQKAWQGRAGFEFDDIMYTFGPMAWLGWLFPLLVGASIGGPVFALWTWSRLRRGADNPE